MLDFVLEWVFKSDYNLVFKDSLEKSLAAVDMYVWYYYLVGIAKYYLKNKNKKLSRTDLRVAGIKTMVEYLSNPVNIGEKSDIDIEKVYKNELFKRLDDAKSDRKLKKIIESYSP